DKDKKDKDKKDKDKKDKDKKDKDKKDKDKEKKESQLGAEWKINVSKNLDNIIIAYEKIVNIFNDIDNYLLKEVNSKEEFEEKVRGLIKDLPEATQEIFTTFLKSLP
ncbi:MAG: hypothetical protein ACFFAS_03265, partial [Promethearchaeota archaeon]